LAQTQSLFLELELDKVPASFREILYQAILLKVAEVMLGMILALAPKVQFSDILQKPPEVVQDMVLDFLP
jgi:hypothetical protein